MVSANRDCMSCDRRAITYDSTVATPLTTMIVTPCDCQRVIPGNSACLVASKARLQASMTMAVTATGLTTVAAAEVSCSTCRAGATPADFTRATNLDL